MHVDCSRCVDLFRRVETFYSLVANVIVADHRGTVERGREISLFSHPPQSKKWAISSHSIAVWRPDANWAWA